MIKVDVTFLTPWNKLHYINTKVENISKTKQIAIDFFMYTLKKERLKITQLVMVHFIKMNELKLTQLELF